MRALLPTVFSLILSLPIFCQQIQYEIRGKVSRLNNNKKFIYLYLTTGIGTGKTDTASIDEEGMFTFKGSSPESQQALLQIDSSGDAFFWIDSGLINIHLTEGKIKNNPITALRITDIIGPTDTYLYQYSNEIGRRAYNFVVLPKGTDANEFVKNWPPQLAGMSLVYSEDEWEMKRDSVLYHCIDSIMRERPNCKILPHYVRFYSRSLGPVKTGKLYSRLSPELKNSKEGKEIKEYLDRQSVLQTGSVFSNFHMKDATGKTFNLNDVKTRFILLDFWASWCGPCRANHPYLRQANEKYAGRGLTIVSISLDDDREDWLKGIKTDSLNWTNISDLKEFDGALAKRCKLSAIPYSILLDKNKRIVQQDLAGTELLAVLEELLK